MIKVGQVYKVRSGETFRIESYDDATFTARLLAPDGSWGSLMFEGEGLKLPMFLKIEKAKRVISLEETV